MIIKDHLNRTIEISKGANRIISLVPSQTEYLFDLGLNDQIVGITQFCIHPKEKVNKVTKVGGTKRLNFDKIDSLSPDIIIANKEENNKADIECLAEKYPVWISDINTLEEAYKMMLDLGLLFNKQRKSVEIVNNIKANFQSLKSVSEKSVAYLIWQNPIMVAATETYINEMLSLAGFKNVFSDQKRYPEVSEEQLVKAAPDFVFLSSEPFPFKQKHISYYAQLLPNSKIVLVDGEMFSWYGSRLLGFVEYFDRKLSISLL